MRIRRSVLLTPGHRRERLEKALTLGADAVAFDLEDGVPATRKAEARSVIAAVLQASAAAATERAVRINGLETPEWQADLAALPLDQVDALLVPKVERPETLHRLADALARIEARIGRPPVPLIATIETPRGVFAALAIAEATPRVTGLFFGPGDYTMQTGGALTPASLAFPRGAIVAAAGAVGCQAIDAPFLGDIKDPDGTAADAALAKELGFSGKVAFHPAQVAPINAAFTPTPAEVARAARIVQAWEVAQAAGEAVVVTDGEFIALDLVPRMRRILELARHARVEA
ncbi:MAG: CoA ester lyase [Rhodospirillales bacterium]|nr:CoA ester lyase [Rhodospirillales bacterium]